MKQIDLAGKRFGRLQVIASTNRTAHRTRFWLCRCDCGKTSEVSGAALRRGATQSCGCLREELVKTRAIKHGMSGTHIYGTYRTMIARCHNPNAIGFRDYGAKGIQVCERWRESFQNFIDDMGPKPSPQHSIDRIESTGNYEPSNCRWATVIEQARNKSSNKLVHFRGSTKTLAEWCELLSLSYHTIKCRLKKGWTAEDALTKPIAAGAKQCL